MKINLQQFKNKYLLYTIWKRKNNMNKISFEDIIELNIDYNRIKKSF